MTKTLKAVDLPLSRTLNIGNLRVHALEAGIQWLDGGAMFGVVPRPLWEKKIPPDERHRIPLALRCLLIEAPNTLVLVDTGIGNKEGEKFRKIYGVDNDGSPTRLEDAMASLGVQPGDVDLVVSTHLHFDHVGGVGHPDHTGVRRPTLPSAKVYVQRSHWERARRPGPKEARSFRAEDLDIIEGMGLEFLDGEEEILPGLTVRPSQGHTAGLQMVIAQGAKDTLYYPSDLIPTLPHIRSAYTMGYDMWPDRLIEEKATLLEEIVEKDGLLVFVHDPQTAACRLQRGASGVSVRSKVTL